VTFLSALRDNTVNKYNAGALPHFDVLRQDVEVSNAVALRVQTVGDYRVAKQRFVEQLGYNVPPSVSDDLSLTLTTPLEAQPYGKGLETALRDAILNRTEIAALEKEERLRDEAIIVAKSGLKPSVQAFAGYQLLSQVQSREFTDQVHGALIGGQFTWPIFDGFLTKGRVAEAVALRKKASDALAETTRIVELQVRTAWSNLRTARAVLDAQADNVAKGERAPRARSDPLQRRGRHTDRRAQRPDRTHRGARIFCRCPTQLLGRPRQPPACDGRRSAMVVKKKKVGIPFSTKYHK
jgi:outer membrane protein TolC